MHEGREIYLFMNELFSPGREEEEEDGRGTAEEGGAWEETQGAGGAHQEHAQTKLCHH